jgi:hypothetical protein
MVKVLCFDALLQVLILKELLLVVETGNSALRAGKAGRNTR